jgi:phosphoglycolate phosphatase
MRFSAVIFDLDGTLADTLKDLADATNWGLRQLGFPEHSLSEYRYLVGSGRTELCRLALPKDRQELVEKLVNLMTGYYADHCFDSSQLYSGIVETLTELNQKGVRLAVLSNKPQDFVELTVKKLLSQFQFDVVIGDRQDIPRKPDPEGAKQIAAALKLSPDKIAYVGDTLIDMQTANRAGMYAVGVSWGFRDREELIEHGAKIIIATPTQLLPIRIEDI